MTTHRPIRLDRLAEELRVPRVTAWRWHVHGEVRGDNQRSGRGKGIRLSRDEALEFCAIALLRTARVPMPRVRSIVEQLRAEGKRGAAFWDAPLRFEALGFPFTPGQMRSVAGRVTRIIEKLEAAP